MLNIVLGPLHEQKFEQYTAVCRFNGIVDLLINAMKKSGLTHSEKNRVIAKLVPYQKNIFINKLIEDRKLEFYFSTRIEIILSGFFGGSPLFMLSTNSIPFTTRPQTVYFPSKKSASFKTIKN